MTDQSETALTNAQLREIRERVSRLPSRAMNLPPKRLSDISNTWMAGYRVGHRDSRHAAAELSREASADITALLREVERLREIESKLPKTADGVSVVPNVDPIWIDPESDGWMDEGPPIESWDENDNYVPAPIAQVKSWAHYGDHCWVVLEGQDEGHHWDGQFFSSELAASQSKGVEDG